MVTSSNTRNGQGIDGIDPSVIDALAGIMSAKAMRSLLADMVRDASTRLSRLSEVHVADASLSVIERDAHDLKSMGGNFGLIGLADLAGTVERAARNGAVESVRTTMPALLAMGHQSLGSLAKKHEIYCERAS